MFGKRGGIVIFIAIFLLLGAVIFAVVYFAFPQDQDGVNVPPIISEPEEGEAVVNESVPHVTNETSNETEDVPLVNDSFVHSAQIHWNHMPLTFAILNKSDNCSDASLSEFYEALSLVEEGTDGAVSFLEINASNVSVPDITVYCVQNEDLLNESLGGYVCEEKVFDYQKDYINPSAEGILGEEDIFIDVTLLNKTSNETKYEVCSIPVSSPAWIYNQFSEARIDIVNDSLIVNATMNIYSDGWNDCVKVPVQEIRDLFHILGFAHSEEAQFDSRHGWVPIDIPLLRDVMYPQIQCIFQTTVDEKYYSCLNEIYGSGGSCDDVGFVYLEDGAWQY